MKGKPIPYNIAAAIEHSLGISFVSSDQALGFKNEQPFCLTLSLLVSRGRLSNWGRGFERGFDISFVSSDQAGPAAGAGTEDMEEAGTTCCVVFLYCAYPPLPPPLGVLTF